MDTIRPSRRLEEVTEYYFSKKLQEIRDLEAQGHSILNLGIGNPDLPPSDSTIKTLINSASDPSNHGYQSYKSIPELRQSISMWSREKYNIDLNPDSEILPLIGSKEGIMHVSMAFLDSGDEVLVPNPGYPVYSAVAKLAGASVKTYDLTLANDWQIDIDELKDRDLNRVKIMWINYPHMPTGSTSSDGLFESLIDLAIERKFLLVNDNPYSLILNPHPKSVLETSRAKEVALELNSLSKSHHMAGWRLGWLSGAPHYLQAVLRFKSNIDSGLFLPIQHAAIAAMKNSMLWHQEQNDTLEQRRALVWKILDALGCRYDRGQVGLFVWAQVPDEVENVEQLVDDLILDGGVFITPGFIFGSNGARFVRISLCNKEKILGEALTRVLRFVEAKVQAP